MNIIDIGKLKVVTSLKCGSTFLHNIKFCLEKDNLINNITMDKQIIILRNPYDRIISYYLNKLINSKGKRCPIWHKNSVMEYCTDFNNIYQLIDDKYKHLYEQELLINLSFTDFLDVLFKIDINHLEPHLLPQKQILNDTNLNTHDIIDLNSLTDTLINYFNLHNINIIPYLNNHYNSTIYNKSLNIYCGDWKIKDYKDNDTPNNTIYNYFNEEMLNKFNNYYKDDIHIFTNYTNN